METDKNPMPQMELFPRLAAVGRFIVRNLSIYPEGTDLSLSTHIREPQAELQE